MTSGTYHSLHLDIATFDSSSIISQIPASTFGKVTETLQRQHLSLHMAKYLKPMERWSYIRLCTAEKAEKIINKM